MIIHSRTTEVFLKRIKEDVRFIMAIEMGLPLARTRFTWEDYTYPLNLVCFEGSSLGYFDSLTYTIALNKSLMYSANTSTLRNILRHELGHLITYLKHGEYVSAHGEEFRAVCASYGWTKEVWGAKVDLSSVNAKEDQFCEEKIIAKVKKLLALADSDNVHEAESATLKANQLLVRHNLAALHQGTSQEEEDQEYCSLKTIAGARMTRKFQAIYSILETFCVYPIFSYARGETAIKVTGTRENVLIAEYVAQFLDQELERLYEQSGLRGVRKKNSFMEGVADGYLLKHRECEKKLNNQDRQGLIVLKDQLEKRVRKIHRHRGSVRSTGRIDKMAHSHGKELGKNLTINPGIQNDSQVNYLE